MMTPGTVVVAKHPTYRGAWWGTVVTIDGDRTAVLFDVDKQLAGEPQWLPTAVVLARELPVEYLDDGIGGHYWRKDCEVEAELAAFHHEPANQGKVFWPDTYID